MHSPKFHGIVLLQSLLFDQENSMLSYLLVLSGSGEPGISEYREVLRSHWILLHMKNPEQNIKFLHVAYRSIHHLSGCLALFFLRTMVMDIDSPCLDAVAGILVSAAPERLPRKSEDPVLVANFPAWKCNAFFPSFFWLPSNSSDCPLNGAACRIVMA